MNVAVLTTETIHHCLFVEKLIDVFPIKLLAIEQDQFTPPFKIDHPFEKQREEYERDVSFNGKIPTLSDYCESISVSNINNLNPNKIAKYSIDVIIVFGTSPIKNNLLALYDKRLVNLHGGDPELYRGLDSHLWAIYHKDYSSIVSTLHHIDSNIDTGPIISKSNINIFNNMELYQLRLENTIACINMTISALLSYQRFGFFISAKQKTLGRYYSFIPRGLKNICINNFRNHTKKLT